MSRKLFIALAIGVVTAMALAVSYVMGVFEGRGDILSKDVCRSFSNGESAAAAYRRILPESRSYEFQDASTVTEGRNFKTGCFAVGDGKDLLNVDSRMQTSVPWREWMDRGLPKRISGKIEYFDAGVKGFTASRFAGIWVPCYSKASSAGKEYNLSVVAYPISGTGASDGKINEGLKDLAVNMARYAHKKAGCDRSGNLDLS